MEEPLLGNSRYVWITPLNSAPTTISDANNPTIIYCPCCGVFRISTPGVFRVSYNSERNPSVRQPVACDALGARIRRVRVFPLSTIIVQFERSRNVYLDIPGGDSWNHVPTDCDILMLSGRNVPITIELGSRYEVHHEDIIPRIAFAS